MVKLKYYDKTFKIKKIIKCNTVLYTIILKRDSINV